MSFGIWQRTIVDEVGNVLNGATVEVRVPSSDFTGSLVTIYSDEGSTAIGNPLTADSEGFAQFYAAPQKVDIRATSDGVTRTWLNVPISGTAALKDHGTGSDQVPLNSDLGTAAVADTLDFRENTTLSTSGTLPTPTDYGTQYVTYTGATGTLTLPTLASTPVGGMIVVVKDNGTQGAVDISPDGTDSVQWGTAQLRLYADGNVWGVRRGASNWELVFGSETGSNANGDYEKTSSGRLVCTNEIILNLVFASKVESSWTFPSTFSETPFVSASRVSPESDATPSDDMYASILTFNPSTTQVPSIAQFRQAGQTDFQSGDTVTVTVFAIGEWY